MTDEKELILSELRRVRAMLFKNEQLFEFAEDDAETEALIYENRALNIRYSSLIRKAKDAGIREEELLWRK
ncbi:MAG: DUF2508 family protein [Ruminiclostridium sp.]|nr:DUF2508 family protein [Ruminiclostridium sp.]